MTEDTLRIESPTYQRMQKLSDAQIVALTSALRGVIQRETSCAEEAAGITIAVLATFCMDLANDDIEAMAKELQKVKNRIVGDFRQGKFRMQQVPRA